MPQVDFSNFTYYPDLRCTNGELVGYRRLSDEDKTAILPIFGLGWLGFNVDFSQVATRLRESVGERSFILDLDHRPAPPSYVSQHPQDPDAQERRLANERPAQEAYNARLEQLLSPVDGFVAWREFSSTFPSAVPMIQYRDPDSESASILRQAARFSALGGSIAIRVALSDVELLRPIILQIIAILEAPERLLIVVDAGQGRRGIENRGAAAAGFLSSIGEVLDISDSARLIAVLISNSFTTSSHDEMRIIPNLDWRLWRAAREAFPFLYGDYGATPRANVNASYIPPDTKPTVVFPLDEDWLVYRALDLNNPQGWVDGAEAVVAHDRYDGPIAAWGNSIISQAEGGDLSGIDSARHWRAAKVNLHIYRQIRHSRDLLSDGVPLDLDELF